MGNTVKKGQSFCEQRPHPGLVIHGDGGTGDCSEEKSGFLLDITKVVFSYALYSRSCVLKLPYM